MLSRRRSGWLTPCRLSRNEQSYGVLSNRSRLSNTTRWRSARWSARKLSRLWFWAKSGSCAIASTNWKTVLRSRNQSGLSLASEPRWDCSRRALKLWNPIRVNSSSRKIAAPRLHNYWRELSIGLSWAGWRSSTFISKTLWRSKSWIWKSPMGYHAIRGPISSPTRSTNSI